MHKSSVIEIIKHFSEEELTRFNDFVNSPYYNKNKSVRKLYAEIKKHSKIFESENLKKENIWKKIYPGKNFNYGVMKNLIHELTKLLEQFIVVEYSAKDELTYIRNLIYALLEQRNFKLYNHKYNKVLNNYFKNSNKRLTTFANKYYELYSEIILSKAHDPLTFKKIESLGEIITTSENFSAISILILSMINFLNIKPLMNIGGIASEETMIQSLQLLDEKKINKILNYLKKNSQKDYRILNCYYMFYLSMSNLSDIKLYYKTKETLAEERNLFSRKELRILCIGLHNLCYNMPIEVNKINEHYEIYKFMDENDVLLEETNLIHHINYDNYVYQLINLKKTDELEQFINKYSQYLDEKGQESYFNYAMAELNFLKGKFEKSLEHLIKINDEFAKLKVPIKVLHIKCFYELNEYEKFKYLYESYKRFQPKNEQVSEDRTERTLKLCKWVTKLFELRERRSIYEIEKLKKEFDSMHKLPYRVWIKEKIDELVKENKNLNTSKNKR
ncbi:MAG TPA: hypothetical protein VHP32_11955 [Ignavibacteria bacterium]|nr:hypothetical protein [Ignavibacteria bacterium]